MGISELNAGRPSVLPIFVWSGHRVAAIVQVEWNLPINGVVMPTPLARIYRCVLDEALTLASASAGANTQAQAEIAHAFQLAIPTIEPARLGYDVGSATMSATLRSEAAKLLLRVCASSAMPRVAFIAAVAEAAMAQAS
jgi:hypothetical protein